MEDIKTIKITNDKGEIVEAKAITILKNPSNDKQYLLYTFDIEKEDVDIYAAIVTKENDVYNLNTITDEEDWNIIQNAVKNIIGE